MWWILREMLKKCELCLGQIENIDTRDLLVRDITAPRFEIRSDKAMKLESKVDITIRNGCSPDYGDALAYACFIKLYRSYNKRQVNNSQYQRPRNMSEAFFGVRR